MSLRKLVSQGSSLFAAALVAASMALASAGCEGPAGPPGANGDAGPSGEAGTPGTPGTDGRHAVFTEPGLELELVSAGIVDGVATVDFEITDGDGAPLDLDGTFTEGEVVVRFVLSWLSARDDEGPGHYTAYTTRTASNTTTGLTNDQASTDSGGTFTELGVGEGRYRYTFGTAITVADLSATHTVGAFATREVDGARSVSNDTLDFVPSGAAADTRGIVTDAACSSCHGEVVSAHGGAREGVAMCILCHTPQTIDPDTGSSMDFPVMIHKIHRGEHLPSVERGEPYEIIGYMGSIADFSHVVFPRPIEDCTACHQGADGDVWLRRPTASNCLSCHDRTSFVDPPPAGFDLHGGGTQPDDAPCAVCHPGTGSIAGLREMHETALTALSRPVITITLLSMTNTAPGQQPVLTFRVEVNGAPRDLVVAPLASLRATIAGPNEGIAAFYQGNIQGSGAEGTLAAVVGSPGEYTYTFSASDVIPLTALGSYTVGVEGSLNTTPGRVPAFSPTLAFAVTDTSAVARRAVVDAAKCNSCHGELAFHGGARENPNYCVLCHNGNNANDERIGRVEGSTILAESVDFRVMIHAIHAGNDRSRPYVLGGNPTPTATNPAGTPVDFTRMEYPRSQADCAACHLEGTFELPVPDGRVPSLLERWSCTEPGSSDTNAYCDAPYWNRVEEIRLAPDRAVCTGCHDSPDTAAHAEIMTTSSGEESCATCHGPGRTADVAAAHAGAL